VLLRPKCPLGPFINQLTRVVSYLPSQTLLPNARFNCPTTRAGIQIHVTMAPVMF
jgi:hypothetical protein